MEKLIIAGKEFSSRLFLGTGKFSCNELMAKAIEVSETEMVTMAMKRIELGNDEDDMMKPIAKPGIQLLPNTPGPRNAAEMPKRLYLPPRWPARRSEQIGSNWKYIPTLAIFCLTLWKLSRLQRFLSRKDSLCYPIVRLTLSSVSVWLKREPLP